MTHWGDVTSCHNLSSHQCDRCFKSLFLQTTKMSFGLEGVNLIIPMALAHPLHPINDRSRNKRRNLWVGWCVSSWWPMFSSRSSASLYIYLYVCILYTGSGYRMYIYIHRECHSVLVELHPITVYMAVFGGACGFSVECHLLFSLVSTICALLYGNKINTRMLVTIGICFKLYFDTRHFAFYNLSPSRMFLSLDLLPEYRIQHTIVLLDITSIYSTKIFYMGVSGFATDCPCGVWCRGLTTGLLHVGPLFGHLLLNNSWAVGLTCWIVNSHIFLYFDIYNCVCLNTSFKCV